MRLDAWLKEQPSLYERLRFVEQLAIAVDETNRMRQPLGLLEPGRVEVADDQECDLKSARGRTDATAPYAAPERLEGAPASAESDIYSAGAIAWEVLAGRPCSDPPEHLSTACRDVARELADAIMACLERSPEWRPKDLSYVAELAKAGQQEAARTAPRAARKQVAARAAAAPAAAPARTASRERRPPSAPGSRGLYLALVAVLLAGAGALAFYLFSPFGRGGAPGSPTPAPVRPESLAASPVAPTLAAATATPPPSAAATLAPRVATRPTPPAATPVAAAPVPTAQAPLTRPATVPTTAPDTTPAIGTAAPSTPTARPPVGETRPQPPPATTTAAPPQAPPPQAAPPQAPPQTQTVAAQPAPPPVAPPVTTVPPAATTAAARPPATLTAVSPLSARRGGKVLFDLHGTGLHDGLRAAIMAVKEMPRGITIVRQKCSSDTVMNVLVDIDASAAPGVYAIVLDDPAGHQTKPLTFTVAR